MQWHETTKSHQTDRVSKSVFNPEPCSDWTEPWLLAFKLTEKHVLHQYPQIVSRKCIDDDQKFVIYKF